MVGYELTTPKVVKHLLDSHKRVEGQFFTDGGGYCRLVIGTSLLKE